MEIARIVVNTVYPSKGIIYLGQIGIGRDEVIMNCLLYRYRYVLKQDLEHRGDTGRSPGAGQDLCQSENRKH